MAKLIIQAANIHNGGGQVLLTHLLAGVPIELNPILLVDARFAAFGNIPDGVSVRYINGTLFQRFLAEWWLLRNVHRGDVVLCLGNLPPLFRLRGRVVVFVQNRYLVDWISLRLLSIKLRVRITFERLWMLLRGSSADQYVVQTPSMLYLLRDLVKKWSKPVTLMPYSNLPREYMRSHSPSIAKGEADFIYVASGEPHKNHKTLIAAWRILAKQGYRPTLWLTVSKNANHELNAFLQSEIQANNLNITNLGIQPHENILALYKRSKALIYPSTFESFGLPLIEARQAEISIVASELDYVRDIVDPEETFDPHSAVSIARAVKRFMGWPEDSLSLVDASHFLQTIIESGAEK